MRSTLTTRPFPSGGVPDGLMGTPFSGVAVSGLYKSCSFWGFRVGGPLPGGWPAASKSAFFF